MMSERPKTFEARETQLLSDMQQFISENNLATKCQPSSWQELLCNHLPETISVTIADNLRKRAISYARNGELFIACEIYKKIESSTEELYVIAREAAGAAFGTTFDECGLIFRYGTDEEIERTIALCQVRREFWKCPTGKVRDTVLAIHECAKEKYGRYIGIYGPEYFVMQDLIDKYDLIVGIANAGVSAPFVASALGHSNVGIVEYHRHWEKKKPRWQFPPSVEHAEQILLCDNDAVSGRTVENTVSFLSQRCRPKAIDMIFTGDSVACSESAVSNIPLLRKVMHACTLQQERTYAHIQKILQGLMKKSL